MTRDINLTDTFITVESQATHSDPRQMVSSTVKNKSATDLANSILPMQNNKKETCDVTLICGDRQFPAHKFVLAARSNVFAAMFRQDMKEAFTNEVKIQDTDPDTLQYFLR